MHVTVLGAGSWGTAISILLARNGHDIALVGRNDQDIEIMRRAKENLHYLPGYILPDEISVVPETEAPAESDLWIIAVPSGGVRHILPLVKGDKPIVVNASKGLEHGSAKLPCEVIQEELPNAVAGAISGPNLAVEIVQKIPTAAVAASFDNSAAEKARSVFMCHTFRVYISEDVLGVELAGAMKNVLAIGAGMSDGLGFGDNTKGALLARGLHEMTTLGLAMGAKMETFMGIAGVGDLFATAASRLSRNYRVGVSIGQGESLHDALTEIGQVAEGVPTSDSVLMLGRKFDVPMPVFESIESVLRGRQMPMEAVGRLMERTPRAEGTL